ncbi:hypothetical protein JB92DRAFT_2836189 [Gautieria morchelliformis]|nr:hypothetical protein JB92DRAFT_2836189 [Gautieria morchelliformis]
MSQHNQGVRWVLGALGLLLYMGSLGTGVFIVVKGACNATAQELGALHCCGLTDHLFLAETMNNVFLILFDTLVVVVTLYNTLGLVRRSREFQMLPRKSLTQTLAEQASAITTKLMKVLRPSISGILSTVQDSLSVIVICRCHLALQERVAHPNGTIHSAHHPVTSFRAATRHIHNSLIEEFGDLSVSETGASEHHGKDGPSSTAVVGIELEEIRHGGSLGVVWMIPPVRSLLNRKLVYGGMTPPEAEEE